MKRISLLITLLCFTAVMVNAQDNKSTLEENAKNVKVIKKHDITKTSLDKAENVEVQKAITKRVEATKDVSSVDVRETKTATKASCSKAKAASCSKAKAASCAGKSKAACCDKGKEGACCSKSAKKACSKSKSASATKVTKAEEAPIAQ